MLLFTDSFDDRDINHIGDRYEYTRLSPITGNTRLVTGRTENGLVLSTNQVDGPFPDILQKNFPEDHQTLIVGVACTLTGPTPVLSLRDRIDDQLGTAQVYVRMDAGRTLSVVKSTDPETVLGTSTQKIVLGTFYYIEFKATIDTVAGSYELRVDGTRWVSADGVNTSATGTQVANQVRFIHTGGAGEYADRIIDDLYIADDSTDSGRATITDFAGPVHVAALLPEANGATNAWTPSAGSNFQCVDETAGENGDTDYVSTNSLLAGVTDLYALEDMPLVTGWGGTIVGIMGHQWCRRTDALLRDLNAVARVAAAEYAHGLGTEQIEATYGRLQRGYEKNPATLQAWTLAEINALQYGVVTGARYI